MGAGSAGSVLAARISADPSVLVTVLEAGPAPADPRVREQISDGLRLPIGLASSVVQRYATTLTEQPRRHAQILRGRVVGGSGAVNGGYFCRGLPSDFDGWRLPGWDWADVLPHFRAIETDLDFGAGPLHGGDGPITVRRVREFDGCTAAFVRSATQAGLPWIEDLNGAGPDTPLRPGVGAVPLNIDRGTRVGPGGAFLEPALGRANLTLRSATRAVRVRFDGMRAVGVDGIGPDGSAHFSADRIVLCAGAIGTAQLLLLSGVGPQRQLRPLGIPVVADLPVGTACRDHPEWVLPVDWTPTDGMPPLEAVLTTGTGVEIRPYTAGFGAMASGRRDDPADRPHVGVALMRPGTRGRVSLASAHPDDPPVIEHRYDTEAADVATLREGARLAAELASVTTQVEQPSWSTSQHLCGTAPMGVDGDAAAVLDPQCRVLGVEGLWVADGSVFPEITSRGPHATIVMVGHRAAEFVVS